MKEAENRTDTGCLGARTHGFGLMDERKRADHGRRLGGAVNVDPDASFWEEQRKNNSAGRAVGAGDCIRKNWNVGTWA